MRFVLNVMGEELNLMSDLERIILYFNESIKDNGHPEQTICKVCIEDLAKAIEQYVTKVRIDQLRKDYGRFGNETLYACFQNDLIDLEELNKELQGDKGESNDKER